MTKKMTWVVAAVIVLGVLLLAIGGPFTASPLSSKTAAYVTDRNLALAVLLVVLLLTAQARTLAIAVLVTGVMHAVDAGFDARLGDSAATIGSLVFAILFLGSAAWLLRQPAMPLFAGIGIKSGRSAEPSNRL